ncbi:MAG: replication-associated recombination protein A, partial [Phycisphaerales bacterium]|nr:replication-associated recombination protein A [Phycisphaerales bacterium]
PFPLPSLVPDLFASRRQAALEGVMPLARKMRPRTLDEVLGQQHLLGPGKLLSRMIAADSLSSVILFGPPGVGKTTLAEVIGGAMKRHVERENAASVGVARIREIIAAAQRRIEDSGQRTILFLDEIHRFSRSQQDALLGDVERGVITLIGATTENPLFAVNSALVSRSTLLKLEPLSEADIAALLHRAIADPQRGFGTLNLIVQPDAIDLWARLSDGDARRALTALDVAVRSAQHEQRLASPASTAQRVEHGQSVQEDRPSDAQAAPAAQSHAGAGRAGSPAGQAIVIDRAAAEESIQQKAAAYDGTGDEHYDSISALIKSIRGSDPDSAVYWLARMLEAGEDPRFIARRLAILASEDIGNADPRAITLAESTWQLVERLGMPECRITLSQCAIYLALAGKSNASYIAIEEALADVRSGRTIAVPGAIKDRRVKKAARLGSGTNVADGYAYSHDAATTGPAGDIGGITAQDYLGVDKTYYRPTQRGAEKVLAERLEIVRAERKRLRESQTGD